jgi:hypothetical protein
VAVVEAIHNAGNGWRDLPVKGAALSEDNMDGNHHGAQLSIPVSVLHQSSCKFCAGLHYTAVIASTSPRHLLLAFCDIGNVAGTALQQAYPKAYSSSVKVSSILLPHRNATQHSSCSILPTNSNPIKLQQH